MSLIVYTIAIQYFKLIFKKLRPIKQNIKLHWPTYLCFSPKKPQSLCSKKKEKPAPRKRNNFFIFIDWSDFVISLSYKIKEGPKMF